MARILVANHDMRRMATRGGVDIIHPMSIGIGLVVVAVVAGLGWWLRGRLRELEGKVADLRLAKRELERRVADVETGVQVTRTHLADVAGGEAPERGDIISGKAWRDIQPAPALVMYQQTPSLFVLDVRTEAEWANGHIPRATLIPIDELEDRLRELPPKDARMLVYCAAGGRSLQACQTLADHGWTRLLLLAGGMHAWPGPREEGTAAAVPPPAANLPQGTTINHRGGAISEAQVVGAIRECFDPEIPLNIYDLGLVYDIDIAADAIAVKMTLTSEACPSARAIPLDVKNRIAALGQDNVRVDVVFDPPWHPSRISDEGKQKLGL
jgi:metal-sulfur cluster biosynthetic enzyme/rhodanese-related sulfurtransferase